MDSGAKATGRQEWQHRAEATIPSDRFFAVLMLVLSQHGFVRQPGFTPRIAQGPDCLAVPCIPVDLPSQARISHASKAGEIEET